VRMGNGVVWVDDFAFWTFVREHALCAGLAGSCTVCLEYLPHAERLEEDWQELCERLGISLNDDKRQVPSQQPNYAGFDFDTVRGLVLAAADEVAKLLACPSAWLELTEILPRELASIQERVLHYSFAIRYCYLRIVSTQIFCLLGPVPEPEYDRPVPVSEEMPVCALPGAGGQHGRGAFPPGWASALGADTVLDAAEGIPQGTGGRRPVVRPRMGRLAARLGRLAPVPPVVRRVEQGARPAGPAARGELARRRERCRPGSPRGASGPPSLGGCLPGSRVGLLRNDAEAAIATLTKA
jgi:hypothetical protein